MRGYRDAPRLVDAAVPASSPAGEESGEALLREAVDELRAIRQTLERRAARH
jgi:hypothetical protein